MTSSSFFICVFVILLSVSGHAVVDGRVVGEKPKTVELDAFQRVYEGVMAPLGGPIIPKVLPRPKEMSNFDHYMLTRTVRVGSIDSDGNFKATCTGVIRKNGEVSTAGHCIGENQKGRGLPLNDRIDKNKFAIQIYDPKTKKYRTVPVDGGSFMHDQRMDYASLKVNTGPHNYSEIRMATEGCDHKQLYAAGFGVNEETDAVSDRLRVAQFQIPGNTDYVAADIENSGREDFFRYGRQVPRTKIQVEGRTSENHIAGAYTNKARVCPGDSGGPIYCKVRGKFALAGITTTIRGGLKPGKVPEKKSYQCRQFSWMSGISAQGILNFDQGMRERDARIQEDTDRNIMERMYAGEEPPGVR